MRCGVAAAGCVAAARGFGRAGFFWATQRGGDAPRRPYMDDVGMDMGGCAGLWLGGILDALLR